MRPPRGHGSRRIRPQPPSVAIFLVLAYRIRALIPGRIAFNLHLTISVPARSSLVSRAPVPLHHGAPRDSFLSQNSLGGTVFANWVT